MREIKFRIYFEADEDEPGWMSEPITLLDLLHGEDIEFRNEEDTVSLPLNDFRFFYNKNAKYKILEYTGLHDKNGKEIYEGDVVKFLNKYSDDEPRSNSKVYTFDGTPFCIDVETGEYDVTTLAWAMEHNIEEVEVIGNIYNNPELLEKGKE